MSNDITGRIVKLFGQGGQPPASDLLRQVNTLGKVVKELLEGMEHVHKSLKASLEVTGSLTGKSKELRRDLDLLAAACDVMSKNMVALTTKVCEIDRKTSRLP